MVAEDEDGDQVSHGLAVGVWVQGGGVGRTDVGVDLQVQEIEWKGEVVAVTVPIIPKILRTVAQGCIGLY